MGRILNMPVKEKYKKGQPWDKPLTNKMEVFEERTGKNAVYRGKITGGFEAFLWKLERSKARITKQQEIEVEKKIKWYRKSKKSRSGNINLGKTRNNSKLKAYLLVQEYKDKVQYSVTYKIYDEDKEKWLDYDYRTFSLPKSDDYIALNLIKDSAPN